MSSLRRGRCAEVVHRHMHYEDLHTLRRVFDRFTRVISRLNKAWRVSPFKVSMKASSQMDGLNCLAEKEVSED